MQRWCVLTEMGSKYTFTLAFDKWTVRCENLGNPMSGVIDSTIEYGVQEPTPWPPVVGEGMTFLSLWFDGPYDHPDRIPGGGKHTSNVKQVTLL